MAEPVSETVDSAVEAVNVANVKTVAETSAWTAGQSMVNQIAHQNRVNVLAESLLSVACKNLHEVDPMQAVSAVKALTGDDIAAKVANLVGALSSNQQGVKAAQTTPPVTP